MTLIIVQKSMRTAANLTSTLLAHHVILKLEAILDREAKISHEEFASQIERRLGSGEGDNAKGPDMKVWSKGRGLTDVSVPNTFGRTRLICHQVDWMSTEFCYTPIIQSQSTNTSYDLSPAAESSSDDIAHKGVFLVALGMRYKAYCANLGRSLIVDPSKVCYFRFTHITGPNPTCTFQEQESIYALLLSLQTEMLAYLKDGVAARDAYQHALAFVKEKKPDLEKHFVKNIGHGVRESCLCGWIYSESLS